MTVTIKSLRLKNVTLAYDQQVILSRCDFNFPMNKNCRIVFKTDAEKFYFFQSFVQVEGFTSGEYLINEENVLELSFEEFMHYRLKIGFGFSARGLLHNQTLRQNLELPLRYHKLVKEEDLREVVDHYAEYFRLGTDLEKRPSDVSMQSQKSVLILRAFIHHPELIFLDSPELMISNSMHANLLQLVDDHRKSKNLKHLFFSTQDESLAECLADENVLLIKKKLLSTDDLKKQRMAS